MLAACNSSKHSVSEAAAPAANEPFLIYKTVADYSQNVPVILNADKTMIVSYPSPSDVSVNGQLLKPIELENGYLLDRKGISMNVAFTSYTYEAYSKLDVAPSIDKLKDRIIDDDPLLEFYDCSRHLKIKGDINKVNSLIADEFKGCVRIK
jgi:hypothetical protein